MKHLPTDGLPYYLEFVENSDLLSLFTSESISDFLNSIDEEKAGFRYRSDKWSIKQIVGHITDHERIKIYRAFLTSRNQKVELWGYDQNLLVNNSRFEELTFSELLDDYNNLRKASISFIKGLSENQLNIKGWAGRDEVTLENFLKTIVGHEIHHINIIKEKYLY
ncbi:DinB family protein [Aequorivita sp. SDUM287046]|uniref:DinB family protein n=1 Tax=Aequorivita aurantiaca TaxID=3053356 RepID=A0ABT8DD65_9FLAO|nr:DinB family protein [Aequorivita aurantiaca]MDN3723137.1 DinB family protein [Aequorivita aurantiaca]